MSIFDQANRSINKSLIEQYFGVEKAYWKAGEFWTLNPLRVDRNIGSFSINEHGLYKDFASQDTGSLINLLCKKHGLSKKEAAEKIIVDSGGIVEKDDCRLEKKKITKVEKDEFIKYATSDFFLKDKKNPVFDPWKIKKIFSYYDYKTEDLVFYIARYERNNQKDKTQKNEKLLRPFYESTNDNRWVCKRPDHLLPFPLYNITKIKNNNDPVLVVSGETCAQQKVKGYNLITWQGGDNRIDESDWTPLINRNVIIWPDNDDSGLKAAYKIRDNYINHAVILDIPSKDKKKGWDISDAVKDEIDIVEFIKNSNKIQLMEFIDLDPEYVFDYFLKRKYNKTGLTQLDGIFWKYMKDHYWKIINIENVRSDIQFFLREEGFFDRLEIENKSKMAFKNGVFSFLSEHSLGYFEGNPFKESAVLPYVHFKNGALDVSENKFEFLDRTDKGECFFKKLYPVNCFNFEYRVDLIDKINYENLREYAPTFYFYVMGIIPKRLKKDNDEIHKTFQFIFQMIAYTMSTKKNKPYFFAFYGDEQTAKSCLMKLAKSFVGYEFVVQRSVQELENNRFATSDLWGAKMLVDEDMKSGALLPCDFIKKNSADQSITIERKHENSQHGVKISVAMFFISNFKIRTNGIEGVKRRAIIVKFENKISDDEDDVHILEKITGEFPHGEESGKRSGETFDERTFVMPLVVKEWKNMINNNYIIDRPQWILGSTNELLSEMTSPGEFIKHLSSGENSEISFDHKYSASELYGKYKEWCTEEGRKPVGKAKFIEEARRERDRLEETRTSSERVCFRIIEDTSIRNTDKPEKELSDDDNSESNETLMF